jgi:hypothetical protein
MEPAADAGSATASEGPRAWGATVAKQDQASRMLEMSFRVRACWSVNCSRKDKNAGKTVSGTREPSTGGSEMRFMHSRRSSKAGGGETRDESRVVICSEIESEQNKQT